jgi:hypothetical protein
MAPKKKGKQPADKAKPLNLHNILSIHYLKVIVISILRKPIICHYPLYLPPLIPN